MGSGAWLSPKAPDQQTGQVGLQGPWLACQAHQQAVKGSFPAFPVACIDKSVAARMVPSRRHMTRPSPEALAKDSARNCSRLLYSWTLSLPEALEALASHETTTVSRTVSLLGWAERALPSACAAA